MQRIVYAPKAYIFIRSSNLGGKIYDVSTDVVRGSVVQKLGDVSSAQFELRNRYQKWLRDPDTDNRSIFLPMDMVTIWLQRVAGRPVQVFTGYLDSVPYYQGYPGNAMFQATCTLKKLAFTWFDPGLPFFTQWVQTNDGWIFNPATGEGLNAPAKGNAEHIAGTAALDASGRTGQINDTGFANLLGRFMTDIAGWSGDDVLISELNQDIPKLAARLWSNIQNETMMDVKALEDYFSTTMGIKGWSNPSPSTPTDSNGAPTNTPEIQSLVDRMSKIADKNNVPILVLAFTAFVNTHFAEKWNVNPGDDKNWGYGVFALRPQTAASNSGIFGDSVIPTTALIDGKKPSDLLDAAVSAQVFCKLLNAQQGPWVKAARANDLAATKTWAEKALGRELPKVDYTAAFIRAKQICAITQVVTPPNKNPSVVTSQTSFQAPGIQGLMTDAEKKVVSAHYSASDPWLAGFIAKAKAISRSIEVTLPYTTSTDLIAFTGPTEALRKFFLTLDGKTNIDEVEFMPPGANKAQTLKLGVRSNVQTKTYIRPSTLVVRQTNNPLASTNTTSTTPGTGGTDTSGSTDTTGGGITYNQLATFSANAAFAANFAFPTNQVESLMLTGNRALMNDISCLDGVKQFAKASLRTFRSLPDGRFLAFYPDYFGARRKPYWSIYNIELTDFGIQLNDDSLATHVYVVGDTFGVGDGQIDMMDDISTRGVATITQAFMLNSFIEPYEEPDNKTGNNVQPKIGRLFDAYAFLQHYGARPHKEEEPLIRNTLYEFLLAWQKFMYLWAQQFATTISFTFQPEVMAGGLIAFPDHDVQMFCEQVTHNFDYEAGFSSEAVMTAPSLMKTNVDRTHKPGFALGGNINTVGVE